MFFSTISALDAFGIENLTCADWLRSSRAEIPTILRTQGSLDPLDLDTWSCTIMYSLYWVSVLGLSLRPITITSISISVDHYAIRTK